MRPFLRFWWCLRLAAGGRFLRRFAVDGGRACVAGVFCGGVCVFLRFLCLAAGGRAMRVFCGVCVWRRAAVLAAVCGGRPFFAAFCGLRRATVFCGVLWFAAGGRFLRRFAVAGGRPLFAVSGGRRAVVFLRRLAVCGGRPFLRRFAVRGGRPFFAAFRGWRRAMRAFFLRRRCLRFCGVCVLRRTRVFLRHFVRFFFCGFRRAGDFFRSLRWRFRRAFCAFCGVCVWRRAGGFSQLKSQPSDPQCCSTSAARAYPKVGTFQLDNHYSLEL